MSVDVAPSGRTLVFDLLGDLYTLPIDGGKARRITSGQEFDAMPSFSPDGRRIAFVSDRNGAPNLWVMNADGTSARQLSHTEGFGYNYVSPTWTPDGSGVLVSHNNGPAATGLSRRGFTPYDLYLFMLDGGKGQRLTGGAGDEGDGGRAGRGDTRGESHLGARYAGPQHVWYSTSRDPQLFTLDLRTGEVIRRTNREGGAFRPVPSPDGKWLVYATRRHDSTALRLRYLRTGDERWLVLGAQHDQLSTKPTRDLMPGMAFTPDGAALVASYGGKLWKVAVPSGEATPIPFTADVDVPMGASAQFQYSMNDSALLVRQIRFPRISPDGGRVTFVALDRVWVAELPRERRPGETVEARNPRRLTSFDVSEYSPTWSPDGKMIAFVTWTDSTGGVIYRVGVDGSAPEKLSRTSAYYEKLAYTPDGTKLLFARASNADRFETSEQGFAGASDTDADLMWMPSAGGEASLITRLEYLNRLNPPYYGIPHFGPDTGRVLLYDAEHNGLYSLRLDGSDRRLLLRANQLPWNSSGMGPADDIVLSPAGGYAMVLGEQNAFLVTLPRSGAPPTVSLHRPGSGSVPVRRLSKIGATYVGWSDDGKTPFYSIGASLFLLDIEALDSIERAVADSGRTLAAYEPTRVDIRITVPKDRPSANEAIVLRGARLITMKGAEVIENGDMVIRGNRIAALGARGSVEIPAGAKIFDVAGKTILPGYVDTHAHMYAVGWGLHRTEPWQYYANLAYGVTSTRDPQTGTFDVLDYGDRVATGDIIGPRIFTTARAVFGNEDVNSLADARNVLRRYSEFYKTETVKMYAVGDRRHRQWFVQAAGELKLSPTNEGDADFMLDLTHVLDGHAGEEHTLPTHPLYKDVVQLMVQSGVTYTPALIISYGGPNLQEYFTSRYDMYAEKKLQRFWPRSYLEAKASSAQWHRDELYAFPDYAREAAKIAAAGGHIAVGAHGQLQGIGYHFEMWGLAMGGMTLRDVLRSATIVGAHAIGHESDLGSLEPGKLADLQVLDGNPLEDIHNTNTIRYVMKNGRLYEAATLDELWPRQRALPTAQWWMAEERR
jgi:Tol biopolymer transport system component